MEDVHTVAIQSVAWITVIISVLIVIARVVTKVTLVRSITVDDYLISVALVWKFEVSSKPGKHQLIVTFLGIRHWTNHRGVYSGLSRLRQATRSLKPGGLRDGSQGSWTSFHFYSD